jgi:hypothetical protein
MSHNPTQPLWKYEGGPHGAYVLLWRQARAAGRGGYGDATIPRTWPAQTVNEFLRETRAALHRRINLKAGIRGRGRKHGEIYQIEMRRDCRRIRERVTHRVRLHQIMTRELQQRFSHLLSRYDE